MNSLKLIPILLITVIKSFAQSDGPRMTTERWAEDLDYLNRKIQKQFNSFVPGIKDDFNLEVDALRKRLVNLKNYEVACEIQRVLSTLDDGHTELNIGHRTVGFHRVPLSIYFFEDELYILAAHKEFEKLVGGRIIGIGSMSMTEAYQRLKGNMSRDNDMEYLHAGPSYLILTELLACLGVSESPEESSFTVKLSNEETVTHVLKGLDVTSYQSGDWVSVHSIGDVKTPLYLSDRRTSYWYTYLPETEIMYFNFSRTNNQKGQPSIKKVVNEMLKEIDRLTPKKLVIDFRLNNGGNYHLTRPLVDGIKARSWLNQKGRVWAITGRRTFSASSTACIFLKRETETQLIGEPGRTHPNKAQNNEYMTLPNSGFLIEYTTRIKKHWPEYPDLDRIPVDVEISPIFESYAAGRDIVMEYLSGN